MSRVGPSPRGFFEDDSVPLASAKERKDRFEVFWAIAVVVTGLGDCRGDVVRAKRVDAISHARDCRSHDVDRVYLAFLGERFRG